MESQQSSLADEIKKLCDQTNEIEAKSNELEEWRTSFDADQKKRYKEQDKKMAKKLDAQTQ
eukprot:5988633-Ditylum_brightwellii.AAC.1